MTITKYKPYLVGEHRALQMEISRIMKKIAKGKSLTKQEGIVLGDYRYFKKQKR